jgi:hypothetical protein
MSRLSRQCGILDISQTHRPPYTVTELSLLFCVVFIVCNVSLALRAVFCLGVVIFFIIYILYYIVVPLPLRKTPFTVQLNNNNNNNNNNYNFVLAEICWQVTPWLNNIWNYCGTLCNCREGWQFNTQQYRVQPKQRSCCRYYTDLKQLYKY